MDHIEIKIKSDTDGEDLELHNMSLYATDQFINILTALKNIVGFEASPDLKIGVRPGSACLQINDDGGGDHLKIVTDNSLKVIRNEKGRNNVYVRNLKVVQDALRSDLKIDILYVRNDKKVVINKFFKRTFRSTKATDTDLKDYKLEFFYNRAFASGGERKQNFHIREGYRKLTFQCEESESSQIGGLLFRDIHFSAWAYMKGEKMVYRFCDLYIDDDAEYVAEFRNFIEDFYHYEGTESIKSIHYKLKEYFLEQDFHKAKKFIQLFCTEIANVNDLMGILLITKSFKDNDILKPQLIKIEKIVGKKINRTVS